MKFGAAVIQNFMGIGYAEINLCDRGLVNVQGENKDESSAESNGSGKSSIADAISWCFYGRTARGEEGDHVVNRFAKKDCLVQVPVLEGGDRYDIARHRKHKKFKNSLRVTHTDAAGTVTDLTKGTDKLTQAVVNQILGCSYEVFVGAIYAGQEQMPDLPGMTDKQLKVLIEEASGATLLATAYEEARRRLTTHKSSLDMVSNNLMAARTGVTDAGNRLDAAFKGKETFEARRKERIREAATSARTKKDQAIEMKADLDKVPTIADLRHAIDALDMLVDAVSGEQENLRKLDKAVVDVGVALAGLRAQENNAQANVQRLTEAVDTFDDQVGCPCETCARPYTEAEIAPAKKLASEALERASAEYADITTRAEAARNRVKTITDARDRYIASMTDIRSVSEQRAALNADLTRKQATKTIYDRLVADLGFMAGQIKAIQAEPNPFVDEIAAAEKLKTERAAQVAELERQVGEFTGAIKVAELSVKVFGPAGVRAHLLDEVTPFLNDQTAKYLGTLSDGHITATWATLVKDSKGDLKEKFSIEVANEKGAQTFKGVSGGEKRKVRIACALALQDLVARRATKPIDLFIGDEIDDALDSAGLERLTNILEEKARERGSVFIISHNDLKDWVRTTITVKREGGMSTIEETAA